MRVHEGPQAREHLLSAHPVSQLSACSVCLASPHPDKEDSSPGGVGPGECRRHVWSGSLFVPLPAGGQEQSDSGARGRAEVREG